MRWILAMVAIATSLALAGPATAQGGDVGKTIIVLDASGSMWGQVEGEAKITIARRALADLLETLPAEQELGLVAYGHRRKGDCGDIETLVPPGPDTRAAIRAAVEGINPKGKTPLSAAVIAAAEDLRYEEEKATVVLLSDGIETCDLDPCAVGSELEAAGIDFTAHVIGFDVAAEADREQLRCLAENTGGLFVAAGNEEELASALETVSQPPPPPPLVTVTFQASEGEGGPIVREDLVWSLTDSESGELLVANEATDDVTLDLETGRYVVEVLRTSDEAFAGEEVEVTGTDPMTVTLVLPVPMPTATLDAPPTAPAGSTVQVAWTGPEGQNDYVTVAEPGAAPTIYVNYTYVRDGNPLSLQMPPEPGTYEIRYLENARSRVLASRTIEVVEIEATVTAPPTAAAGEDLAVEWTGPDYANDFITVARPEDEGSRYVNYSYTREGSPLKLLMPTEPGTYEVRYVLSQGRRILARQTVEVGAVQATLTVPPTAAAGSELAVEWTGPDYPNDHITVAEPGAPGNRYENYTYTRNGSPLKLLMPTEPGTYEVRYVVNQDKAVLASTTIVVEAVGASLTVPPTAAAGSALVVQWTGPDYPNDHITVAEPGAPGNRYENYTYTRQGNPLQLTMPVEPGDYEIRYVVNQDKQILASVPITVEAVGASLTVPPTAPAGSALVVQWTGPDYPNDHIAVAEPGAPGNRYENYTYTRQGNPLQLTMPVEPGTYEIRYIVNQDKQILASTTIEVEAVSASLTVPPSAVAGSTLVVEWSGPDYPNDHVTVAAPGDPGNRSVNYTYTRQGNPLQLVMPPEPGSYEVRYIVNQDKAILASVPLEVSEVSASLDAPPSGPAGGSVQVQWQGPNYQNDYISIAKADEKGNRYSGYTYTRTGSPLVLKLPDEPGQYELRYIMNQGSRILATLPFTVE